MNFGTIGERIRLQRERIGLSQAQLAEQAGITARSQRNYEAGVRVPNAEYLAALPPLGIDVNYVLNGNVNGNYARDWRSAGSTLLTVISMCFGISIETIDEIVDKALVNVEDGGFDPAIFVAELLKHSAVFKEVTEQQIGLDIDLLTTVLELVTDEVKALGASLTAAKHAEAVCMLYRTFRASNAVDVDFVKQIVRLAIPG